MCAIRTEGIMIISRTATLATGVTLNPNNVWSGSAFEYLKAIDASA
jgi:hypothetical protein